LMVSEVPYYSFKDIHWHNRQPFWLLIAIIVVFKLVIAQPQLALFSSISLYLVSGPIWWLVRRTRRLRRVTQGAANVVSRGGSG
jgi:CDP-diacylglycerol---serine O-phosphatidyltransferase